MPSFKRILMLLLFAGTRSFAGSFEIAENDSGGFRIMHNNAVLAESVEVRIGEERFPAPVKKSVTTAPNGAKIFNLWNELDAKKFRLELVLSPDKDNIEISFASASGAYPQSQVRAISLLLPANVGTEFAGLAGNSRNWNPLQGKLDDAGKKILSDNIWHFFAVSGGTHQEVVFDLQPRGPGDENSMYPSGVVRGIWNVLPEKEHIRIKGGTIFSEDGGDILTKLVIREGSLKNYDVWHAMQRFEYCDRVVPLHQWSFGAVKTGKMFTPAPAKQWVKGQKSLKVVNAAPEGAFYSRIEGENAVFHCTELPPGFYLATFNFGNWAGKNHSFALKDSVSGVAEKIQIAPGELVSLTLPVWIEKGEIEFQFEGEFILSTLSLHRLLASAEDFTIRRSFWVSDGFEPTSIYLNSDTPADFQCKSRLSRITLPEPGKECTAPLKNFEYESAGNLTAPEWCRNVLIASIGGSGGSMSCYEKPEVLTRRLDELQERNINTVMLCALHSRHTFPRSHQRLKAYVAMIADAAHKRNMHLVDHFDATILWNDGCGFRTMLERLNETCREPGGLVPGRNFCIMNPVFSEKCRKYIMELAEAGVDAFQIDEVYFSPTGCRCSHCLESFARETGWQLPLNELDSRLDNSGTELWRTWCDWRKKKVGDWWVETRRQLAQVKPETVLMTYTTHYGLTSDYASNRQGVSITGLGRALNYFGTEIMPRNSLMTARSFPPFRKAFNQMTVEYNTPQFAFVYGSNWDASEYVWAVCRAHNQAPVPHLENCPPDKRDFLKYTSPMPFAAKSDARVALLFSAPSRDWAQVISFEAELFGLAQTLEEMHIPYDIIGEMSLTPKTLSKYKALFLGHAGCLSDGEIAAVKNFAKEGGLVHFSVNAGWFDEHGKRRKTRGFADVFPCQLEDSPTPVKALKKANGSVIPVNKIPSPYWRPLDAEFQPPAETPFYAETGEKTKRPLLWEKKYGKGRFIYQPLPMFVSLYQQEFGVGSECDFELDERLAALNHEWLGKLLKDATELVTDAPAKVQTTLYRHGNVRYLHLLNAQAGTPEKGKAIRAKAPENPWPQCGHDLHFTLTGSKASVAEASSPDWDGTIQLPVTQDREGHNTFTLPKDKLHAYTVIVIKP